MKSENSFLRTFKKHLQKGMLRFARIVPFMVRDFQAADVANGMFASGGPERHLRTGSQSADEARIDCFLENDQVRGRGPNHFREFLFAPSSTETNVIAEQLNNHRAF